ncbi:DEAD-box ATP-dependent RNA helicase 25 [Lathyrus oleraceus]|uniref:DEAD-box ATP-dependent RNA helicase 25 n=1 Tax=Pisum sativum TaxID=3888 RepID=UPI0021D0C569|nr:DEAD-box ATP-dependent RNA helicase 25-like [Pisum sativum]
MPIEIAASSSSIEISTSPSSLEIIVEFSKKDDVLCSLLLSRIFKVEVVIPLIATKNIKNAIDSHLRSPTRKFEFLLLLENLCDKYKSSLDYDRNMVRNVWERTCLDRYLDHLKNAIQIALPEVSSTNLVDTKGYGPQRNLQPEWKKKSDANRLNRAALPDVVLHTRGSINLGEHKKRMYSDEFRKSKGFILVTSDVYARGVDYPDVTLVVQVGLPADREQYIHRLGRTGRRGKEGQGILLLAPWEEFFLATAKDLPIGKAPVPSVDPDTKKKVERALSNMEMKNKEAAYQAWLGYYNSNKKAGKDKYRLVELANEFSRCMGLDSPPAIPKLVLGKMGLKNIPGLRSK